METFTYQGNDWEDRLSVGGELAAEVIASLLGAKFGAKGGRFLDRKFHERGWTPCFPAGTRLKTPTGWKSVEEFRVGDEIVSRAEYRPESANSVRKVTRLLTRSGRVLTLRLQGREIETTHEHPYWVVGKGWVTANALEPGDLFLTSENRTARLDEIIDCGRYATVYNLEVESDHTYFVGGEDWGFDVWSHNHNEGGGGAGSRPELHHSDPIFMGGDPKQKTTSIPKDTHRGAGKSLHNDMNEFLRQKTDGFDNHMRPQRGNPGAMIRDNFTRRERLEALAEFYKKYRDTYPDVARDFFDQHPHLDS